MITIIGRKLVIPDCDRVLGASGDSGTKIRVRLSEETVKRYFPDGATVDNVGITLVMEYKNGGSAFPSVALTYAKDGVHEGYVTIADSRASGLLVARALLTYAHGEGNVAMQTEEDYFLVSDDIDASDVTDKGNTYTAWNAVLKDIKDASSSAVQAEENAKGYAETASGVTENIEAFNKAYGDFSKQAEKANEHYNSRSNPHEVTASQVGAYSQREVDLKVGSVAISVDNVDSRFNNHEINYQNPHKVTAEQVGAYTKEEVDELVNNVDVDLSDYVKNTDYATSGKGGVVKVYAGNGVSVFNGQLALVAATNAQINERKAESVPITPKNLEYAVKSVGDGYYATEAQVGDIDTALDRIIEIQDSFAPEGNLPGEIEPLE